MSKVCDVPPVGWRCTRNKGHEGPCAATPSTPNPVDIPELRRLLEAATPGPWTAFPEPATGCMSICSVGGEHSDCPVEPHCHHCVTASGEAGNAALIVSARNALPALLDELEALRKFHDEHEKCIEDQDAAHFQSMEECHAEIAALRAEVEALREVERAARSARERRLVCITMRNDECNSHATDCPECEIKAALAALDAVRKGECPRCGGAADAPHLIGEGFNGSYPATCNDKFHWDAVRKGGG